MAALTSKDYINAYCDSIRITPAIMNLLNFGLLDTLCICIGATPNKPIYFRNDKNHLSVLHNKLDRDMIVK